jgi:hypothetical protein
MVSLAWLALRPRNTRAVLLGLALLAGFVALSGYLRYQPFNARMHLALLAIGAALIGAFLERLPAKIGNGCGALLVVLSLPYALSNNLRPLVPGRARANEFYPHQSVLQRPREVSYFADGHDHLAASWIAAARAVDATGCRDVGIDASDLYTYPMFALLGAGVTRQVRYMNITNLTRVYAHPNEPSPCAVVCLYCGDPKAKQQSYGSIGSPSRFGEVVTWLAPTPAQSTL